MRLRALGCAAVLALSTVMIGGVSVADEAQPVAAAPGVLVTAQYAPAAPVVQSAPRYIYPVVRRPARPTFFQRVMELERRKNAWLMRTFLGR